MSPQREYTKLLAILNVVANCIRRFWLMALVAGQFLFSRKARTWGTSWFGYYYFYFAEAWPALLPARSG